MTRRHIFLLFVLLMSLPVISGCPSPAAPPAPPAEIPSFLTIPRDLSIGVEELPGSSDSVTLKLATLAPKDIALAISLATEGIEESNRFLDAGLAPASLTDIPVSASTFNFKNDLTFTNDTGTESVDISLKFDFGRFDLDGVNGEESCTGCTCPTGCAPDLAVCPTEAPESEIHPICVRVWLNGKRYMAGVFDRVPTKDNPQSGRIRFELPPFGDLAGSPFGIIYDHGDLNDRQTELSTFFIDTDVAGGTDFFSSRRTFGRIEGPEATALKTSRLTSDFISPPSAIPGTLQFQGRYTSNLDFISLETVAEGVFSSVLGITNVTPPICAQISTANPVNDILCSDLGLMVAPGDFLPQAVFEDVTLPPFSAFPEAPTF